MNTIKSHIRIAAVGSLLGLAAAANADPVVATACNGGACAEIPPEVAAAVIVAGLFEDNMNRNLEGAKRENGAFNKAVKATTGISIRCIKEEGLAGCKNSEVRKAGRFFAKVFGW